MRSTLRVALVAGAATVALAGGSTLALAAVTDGFGTGRTGTAYAPMSRAGAGQVDPSTSCTVPSLPGSVVEVTLADMGGAMAGSGGYAGRDGMGARGMGGTGSGGRPGGPIGGVGMMSVGLSRTSVPAGQVSLAVRNLGVRDHELVVLPLADGAQPGQRTVGPDGTVSEDGSLGEASASCAPDEGDGIASGATGWTTLTLAAGRYELVCNLPGHYAAGMVAELDVTS